MNAARGSAEVRERAGDVAESAAMLDKCGGSSASPLRDARREGEGVLIVADTRRGVVRWDCGDVRVDLRGD